MASRILLVDDEPHVRRALSRILVRAGHVVVACADVGEALELLADPLAFQVVVTDLNLESGTCERILARVRTCDPAIRLVVLTGSQEGVSFASDVAVYRKPIGADALVRAVDLRFGDEAGEPTQLR